ncbi:hypothetical protein ACL07V_30405 [Streptomyces sp. MB22_4]|uniref:hypothetical protein n=1 Tax=Streptomyces sp. MB22_4 TaxID=3383120 RepID=UPI0039A12CFF
MTVAVPALVKQVDRDLREVLDQPETGGAFRLVYAPPQELRAGSAAAVPSRLAA